MKTLRLKLVDFWRGFNPTSNIFLDVLSKRYQVVLCDTPDYIFYSAFGHEYLKYDCIRIFYTAENIRPDFNLCDYAIAFDWMDFEDRYIRFPVYMLYGEDVKRAMEKHNIADSELTPKKFCNFIYSNYQAHSARSEFFKLLSSYKKVDSGGKYLNNIGYQVADKLHFMKDYKFSITFENSLASGYTTEKIIQSFAAKTVPIYWGNPAIGKEFNTKSFINCHDYNSFSDVIKRVIEIDNDDELYLNILKAPIYELIDYSYIPKLSGLERFLDNIFSQDLDMAVRRAKSLHGNLYEKLRHFLINSKRI